MPFPEVASHHNTVNNTANSHILPPIPSLIQAPTTRYEYIIQMQRREMIRNKYGHQEGKVIGIQQIPPQIHPRKQNIHVINVVNHIRIKDIILIYM